MPVKIFICYAREDEALLNKLKAHLRPLQREGLIDVWDDGKIIAGKEWEQEIKERLDTAQMVLLLISPDFMNSDYCYSKEMKRALERHELGEAQVIPVILRPVYWQSAPFGKLQALPTGAKPITGSIWRNIDAAFLSVTEGIQKVVKVLLSSNSSPETKDILLHESHPSPASISQRNTPTVISQDNLYIDLGNLGIVPLRLSSYTSLSDLLNDLYLTFLKKRYLPYTYGKDWMLYSLASDQLIATWGWLLKSKEDSLTTFDPSWATSSPIAYGLMPGTQLALLDKNQVKGYGVATNIHRIASVLLNGRNTDGKFGSLYYSSLSNLFKDMIYGKALSYTGPLVMNDEIHVDMCPAREIDVNSYKFTRVFRQEENINLEAFSFIVKHYSSK